MSKLIKININEDKLLLNEILNDQLIVVEDIQGSKIWIKWDGQNFEIRPKSITNEPINLIDLAMQNYYNPVTKFFSELDDRVKGLLNHKWWFCFEYFPD